MTANEPEWVYNLREKQNYLQEWLAKYRTMSEVAPFVQEDLEYVNWQLDVIGSRPPNAPPLPDLGDSTTLDLANLKTVLPQPAIYSITAIQSAASLGSGVVASLIGYASQAVMMVGDPGVTVYAQQAADSLSKINEDHGIVEKLRDLIQKLGGKGLFDRFVAARASYDAWRIGTQDRKAAAGAMRTLLNGVKGTLIERAKKQQRENNPSWECMSQRLALGDLEGAHYQTLLHSEEAFSRLSDKLSQVLKDYDKGLIDLRSVWLELQSLLDSVIGSVDLRADESS